MEPNCSAFGFIFSFFKVNTNFYFCRDSRKSAEGSGFRFRDFRKSAEGGGSCFRDFRKSAEGGGSHFRDSRKSAEGGGSGFRDSRQYFSLRFSHLPSPPKGGRGVLLLRHQVQHADEVGNIHLAVAVLFTRGSSLFAARIRLPIVTVVIIGFPTFRLDSCHLNGGHHILLVFVVYDSQRSIDSIRQALH